MKARRLLALALVAGLVVGGVSVADAKKKKKKKAKTKTVFVATPAQFFLARPEGGTCAESYLSTTLGPAEQVACGNNFFGVPAEVADAAGQGEAEVPVTGYNFKKRSWAATDGVPFLLDASKTVTGQVEVQSGATLNGNEIGGGMAVLDIAVVGESAGEQVTIGSTTAEYQAVPGPAPVIEFELEIEDALNKKVFTTLALELRNRGNTFLHGYYANDGGTFFHLPTLIKKVVKVRR